MVVYEYRCQRATERWINGFNLEVAETGIGG
jgi:hypothetical protein